MSQRAGGAREGRRRVDFPVNCVEVQLRSSADSRWGGSRLAAAAATSAGVELSPQALQ